MAESRWSYWGGFAVLAAASLAMLFLFVFGFLPQRFLLELDFAESGFAYPVILPPLPEPPPAPAPRRPIARGPAERFWAEYLARVQAGDENAALGLIADYLDRNPDDAQVRVEYARALWRQGRLDAAATAYRQALNAGAGVELRIELARLLVAARRWEEALSLYADLHVARPGDLELRREYARTATWAKRYALARAHYEQLVALRPDDPDLKLALARVLYWSGEPRAAADVLALLPPGFSTAGVDSLRAAVATALPRPDTAHVPVEDVRVPADVPPLERARRLMLAGQVDSALVVYREQLSRGAADDSLLLEMADVFEYRAGVMDSAIAYLRAYLDRRPDDPAVRLRLAQRLAWSGRYAESESELRQVLDARPEDAGAWALLGDLQRWRGDREGARAAYRRALEIDPAEPSAREGQAIMRAQVDAALAAQGRIGPAAGVEYFADSDEFSLARVRGGWLGGGPRRRVGAELEVERLSGFGPAGERSELTAASLRATGDGWWQEGRLNVSASFGAWVPEGEVGAEPIVRVALSTPNRGGASYRVEFRHEPAYRETATLEASLAEVAVDLAGLETFRPLGERWELAARARLARFSGFGHENFRTDAAVDLLFRPDDRWVLGLESRALRFSEPAPRPDRRLYWDPEWSWSNLAVVGWRGEPAQDWELELWATPGIAWLAERDRDRTVVSELAARLEARRRLGVWTLAGLAGFSQSRVDGYRTFRLDLGLTRSFGR